MVRITVFQAFCLMTLFLLGSTVVVGLGLDSEENAWLINLLAMVFGLGLFFLYAFILNRGGWAEFGVLLEKGFGRAGGKIISGLYGLYFFYIGTRVVEDFSYFVSQTLFVNIKEWIIAAVLLTLVGYSCKLGFEALARSAEILFFITMLLVLMLFIMSLMSEVFSLENIMPFFNPDEITWSTFPLRVTFPYGEMVVFLLLFPKVNNPKSLIKKGWLGVVLAGGIILVISEIIIGILGAKVAAIYTYPLVKSIEMIEYLEVIQHLEIFSVFSFLFVGFIKISILYEAGTAAFQNVFTRLKRDYIVYFAVGGGMIGKIYMAESLPQHLFIGLKIIPYLLHIPFQLVFPAVLAIVLMIKKPHQQTS
jgi:spore germination protein KB